MARIFGAVLLLTGAIQFSSGWAGAAAAAVLAAAVLIPYGSMLLAVRMRLPRAWVALGWLVLVLSAGVLIGAGSGDGWLAVLRDGVPRLLTAARPAPATAALLFPGVLLAVLIGVWVGARSARPKGGQFAPLVGAAILYLGGALLSAGEEDRYGVIAFLLVLSGAAGWAATERRSSRGAQRLATVAFSTAASAAVA